MSLTQVDIVDFSRGMRAQGVGPGQFVEGHSQMLEGLWLDDARTLRSQPELVVHETPAPYQLWAFGRFLVATTDGTSTISYIELEKLRDGTGTWKSLTIAGDGYGGRNQFNAVVDWVTSSGSRVSALMCNTDADGSAGTPSWSMVYVDPNDPTLLTFESGTDRYPSGTPDAPDSGKVPGGRVATMWGQFLVIADILWKSDDAQPFDATNMGGYWGSALWISEGGATSTFEPLPINFASAQIVGLHPLAAGLLVLTTKGVWLMRGTPASEPGVETWLPEPLFPDIECEHSVTFPDGQSVVFSDRDGQVWATTGEDIARLNDWGPVEQGLHPLAATDGKVLCQTLDGAEMYVAHLLDDREVAWTKLQADDGTDDFADGAAYHDLAGRGRIRRAVAVDGSFFWLSDVQVGQMGGSWALCELKVRDEGARGTVNGQKPTLTYRSLPLGDPPRWDRKLWHRAGVRVSGRTAPATVGTVTVKGFPSPDTTGQLYVVEHATGVNRSVQLRDLVWAPAGVGGQVELQVQVTFTGDVVLDALMVTYRGKRPRKAAQTEGMA